MGIWFDDAETGMAHKRRSIRPPHRAWHRYHSGRPRPAYDGNRGRAHTLGRLPEIEMADSECRWATGTIDCTWDPRDLWARPHGRPRYVATPLFVVLVLAETTDLIFAMDSIPAIFAVTQDPFIVYTSNVFAILGLRALYFLLAGIIHRFHQGAEELGPVTTLLSPRSSCCSTPSGSRCPCG